MEILWKSLNNIFWTTDDSAIGRINICGVTQILPLAEKSPKKRVLVLNVWTSSCLSCFDENKELSFEDKRLGLLQVDLSTSNRCSEALAHNLQLPQAATTACVPHVDQTS